MRHEMNPIGQEVFAAAQSRSLWRNALLPFERTLLFVVIYFLAVQTVALYRGEPMLVYFIGYAKMLGLVGPLIISVWIAYSAISMAATTRPSSPIREIGGMMITYVADRQRLVSAAIFFTIVFLITAPFSYIKSIIGQIAPFSWDEKLYRLDLAIHGGVLPSDILQPFLGYPALTFAINISYNLWFVAMFGVWIWLAFTKHERAPRQRFLLAFAFVWVLGGNLLAIIFSSAGPCYFGRVVGGDDPYLPLMDYLRTVNEAHFPIWALNTQEMLWSGFGHASGVPASISAMPSMHLATAALFVCVAHRIGGVWFKLSLAFLIIILLGSVHLGWHYAVDGYVGILISVLAWRFAGVLLGPHDDGARASN